MATTSLLGDVETALGLSVDLGYAKKAKQHDLYEAYVLTLFLRAAKTVPGKIWSLQLRDGWGNTVASPLFRLGPGRITSRDYTFVRMTKSGSPDLEAHLGVKVSGKTPVGVSKSTKSRRMLHEFDLLVLPASVADACRANGNDPDYQDVLIHGEMKYYAGKLSLPLGRASLGMAVECDLSGKSVLVTNQLGYTVQDLVEHNGVRFRFRVLPSLSVGKGYLMTWFQTFL